MKRRTLQRDRRRTQSMKRRALHRDRRRTQSMKRRAARPRWSAARGKPARILLAAAVLAAAPASSFAGGMVLPIRGVRTLERGGALVAGADDADALWLDPAGLAHLAGVGKRAFL